MDAIANVAAPERAVNSRRTRKRYRKRVLRTSKAPSDRTSPLAQIRDLALIFTVYLFFAGYVFRSHYYQEFGLPLTVSYSDAAAFIVYSYTVFADNQVWAILGALILATVFVLVTLALRRYRSMGLWVSSACVAVLAFPWIAHMSISAASAEANKIKDSGTWTNETVTFTLTSAAASALKSNDKPLVQLSRSGELHLVTVNQDYAYFLAQRNDPESHRRVNFTVYALPRNDVSAMDIILPAPQ
jgi:hypothetical protein